MDSQHHSPDGEQAILGALMFDNECYDLICDKLRAEHFYNPIHATIYKIMQMALMDGRHVDAIYIKNRMSQDETLTDIGGIEYIALLCQCAPSSPSQQVPAYAGIVIDMAKRRSLEVISARLPEQLGDYDTDAANVIEDLVADADALLLDQSGSTKSQSSAELSDNFISFLDGDKEEAACYSGYADLDRMLGGFVAGRVYVLAGRPSMGKSAQALNIVRNVGMQGKGVVFLSLEMTNEGQSERIVASIGAKLFGPGSFPEYNDLRYQWKQGNRGMITDAAKAFHEMPVEWEEGVGLNLNNIRMVTNRAIRSLRGRGANLDLLVIDHIGHVSGSRRGQSNYEKVTEVSNALIGIAKQYSVPVLALCQLSRAVEQRDDKRPQLSDLRESGHIEQDAAVVIGMYRDFYYAEREARASKGDDGELMERLLKGKNKLELLVLKNRHGNIGQVNLFCDLSRMFIDNQAQDYREAAA